MSRRPITVLFDAHPLLGQKTGVGYYTQQLVTSLAKKYPNELRLVGYYHNFLLRKQITGLPSANNISYRRIVFLPGQIVNFLRRKHLAIPIELLTFCKPDAVLYTNFLGFPSLFKATQIPIIYDLSFIDYPQYASQKNIADLNQLVPPTLRRASFAVTVSNFSQSRIAKQYKFKQENIVVTHVPPPIVKKPAAKAVKKALARYKIEQPFILFVGTLEPRKNLGKLLDAYALLPKNIRDKYSLVIAGKKDWKYAEIINKIDHLIKNGYKVQYLGYVDDATRDILYESARLFVLPAFYEGFGMPILEAFSHGTPCLISDIPVFHEVAANYANYFDPSDVQSIKTNLQKCLTGPPINPKRLMSFVDDNFSLDEICSKLYAKIHSAQK